MAWVVPSEHMRCVKLLNKKAWVVPSRIVFDEMYIAFNISVSLLHKVVKSSCKLPIKKECNGKTRLL